MNGNVSLPLCCYCGEPVFSDPADTVQPWHRACAIRLAVGGLNHLKRLCTCCGGTEPPDPPGLSRREAAEAAYQYWRAADIPSRKPGKSCQ